MIATGTAQAEDTTGAAYLNLAAPALSPNSHSPEVTVGQYHSKMLMWYNCHSLSTVGFTITP